MCCWNNIKYVKELIYKISQMLGQNESHYIVKLSMKLKTLN